MDSDISLPALEDLMIEGSCSRFRFFVSDVQHSVEPFGLIDWDRFCVYYVTGIAKSFPFANRVVDLRTGVSTSIPKGLTISDYVPEEDAYFQERRQYIREALGMLTPPSFDVRWCTSTARSVDGGICRVIKKLQELIGDTRIQNLPQRKAWLSALFGASVELANNELNIQGDRLTISRNFNRFVDQQVAQVWTP